MAVLALDRRHAYGSRCPAEREKHAAAPHPKQIRPFTRDRKLRELVVHGTRDARLESPPHMDVRRGLLGARIGDDANAMVGPGSHLIANIRRKLEQLIATLALGVHKHRDERRVFNFDPRFFCGRHETEAVGIFAQDGRKKSDEFLATDGRSLMKPSPVFRNPDVDVPAMGGIPFLYRRQTAACRRIALKARKSNGNVV